MWAISSPRVCIYFELLVESLPDFRPGSGRLAGGAATPAKPPDRPEGSLRTNPFPLILNPAPTPNNRTSPLLHIGTILGGFSTGGWGGLVLGGRDYILTRYLESRRTVMSLGKGSRGSPTRPIRDYKWL